MENYAETISTLKYSIATYKRMGNGIMSQTLISKLEKLLEKQAAQLS